MSKVGSHSPLVGKVVGRRFFTKLLEHVADLDFKTNGYWDDLDKAETESFSKSHSTVERHS